MAVGLWGVPASAFELDGHEVIEAAAYRRLLALPVVPGTGAPGISGRALLGALIATGVLAEPPCFNRDDPRGDCGVEERLDFPLQYWPVLRSGAPDLVIDRQLGQQGQCQHFMANTADALAPVDAGASVPTALVKTAYLRCIRIAGSAFDGILRDPQLAEWRIAGTYALMHAIQDSFSAAHADRDPQLRIVHLLSWKLIDWPSYWRHGRADFPPATHHAITDHRDADYLQWDARAPDGRACRDFHNPYAVPEACLTDRAKAAAAAVADLLVVTYRLRTDALAAGQSPSLFSRSGNEGTQWLAFAREHLASVSQPAELPPEPRGPLRRPDVFVGLQGIVGDHTLGGGAWGAKLFLGPAAPFALAVTGGAAYTKRGGADQLGAGVSLGLLLPLIRRFTIGAAPAGFRLACDAHFESCKPDVTATLGLLLIPLGEAVWLGVEGPRWSWIEREMGNTWAGLSLGWSQERAARRPPPDAAVVAAWDPPRPEEVRAFRSARSTRMAYLATTAGSSADNAYVGLGLEWRLDRDTWDRRAGFAPGVQIEIDAGRMDGNRQGGGVALAPTLRAYVLPSRLAVTATPALVRAGALAGQALAIDVAARAGIALAVGRLELAVDSPPLSYLARSRWHWLPITVRLGFRFD